MEGCQTALGIAAGDCWPEAARSSARSAARQPARSPRWPMGPRWPVQDMLTAARPSSAATVSLPAARPARSRLQLPFHHQGYPLHSSVLWVQALTSTTPCCSATHPAATRAISSAAQGSHPQPGLLRCGPPPEAEALEQVLQLPRLSRPLHPDTCIMVIQV